MLNNVFRNGLFKWLPHGDQVTCERRLIKIMRRLKIDDYTFNWDRTSSFIEFRYQGDTYRVEHTIQKAKEKGIILRNGLDCLSELIQSLENLGDIVERGTYNLDTWISGMKQSTVAEEIPEFQELHIRYKSLGKQQNARYQREEEFIPEAPESPLRNFDRNQLMQRSQRE